jgi:hypothetical protein
MEHSREFSPRPLKERLKKVLLKSVALSMMFGAHVTGYGQSKSPETRPSPAPAAAEKVEQTKKPFTIAEIRAGLRTDPVERIFIHTNADPADQMFEISGGNTSSGFIEYDKIDRMLATKPGPVSRLKISHTHPLEAYRNIFNNVDMSQTERDEYKTGVKKIPPHPPSMADFQSEGYFQTKYEPKKIEVEGEVIEDTGTWNYSVAKDSKLINQLAAAQAEGESFRAKLSQQDQEILDEAVEKKNVDPRFVMQYLQNLTPEEDPTGAKRKLGDTLENFGAEIEMKYADALRLYQEIETALQAVVLAESEVEKNTAIAEYIELCRQNGIIVKYDTK